MTSILFATSEARPLIKTGGLADVSGALPAALREIGVDCRILLPGYRKVMDALPDLHEVARFHELPYFGNVRLLEGRIPVSETPVYVIDSPWHYLREGGPYQDALGKDFPDNAWRFGLLSYLAARLASPDSPLDWRPDLLHGNDWQTGLAPAYLHYAGHRTPCVMTIHNLAHQGIFPPEMVEELGLPPESFDISGVEYYGNLSFLKAGLYFADWITTVSPSYAEEIQHAHLGMGMQGLLTDRRDHLTGILNGIDTTDWNPAGDPHLNCKYSSRATPGKKGCKQALQAEMGLIADTDAPLFGVVSRLADQKGLDWVLQVSGGILDRGGQLVVLGTGEKTIETALRNLAHNHPGRVAAFIGYDESLSHRIEAGIDIFLMPSRFEPCGLNQMYSLRYGSVPIVHATGGLKDTVEDGVTGFVYREPNSHGLWVAIERALALFAQKPAWRKMMLAGMKQDFSWEKSAREYAALYDRLLT
ncbi:MAG: glycogen synthase GlgA [Parasulfuritortus sp.]|jgi:starch synthase|nr:glycogen synthase GlgA [Parasulfuritortus sp.]